MNWNKLSLKFKLIGGFSTVIILMLIVSLVGFLALKNAASGFGEYREMARDSNLSGRLQANMLIVRMSVKDYLISGSDHALEQFHERWNKMSQLEAVAQKEIQAPERAKKIDEIETALEQYEKGFEQIIKYKAKRNKLVNNVLNVQGPLMENTLTDFMISANDDGDLTASFETGLAMKHLLLARLYMAKFLDTNDKNAITRVHEEFNKMLNNLNKLDKELENPMHRKLLETVRESENLYLKTFNELVTTIVDRNNVITGTMDRIGPEVADKIEDVKLDIKKVQDTIGPRLQSSNKKAVLTIVIISFGAILIGAMVVIFITKSVMSQLGSDPSKIVEIADSIAKGNLAIVFDEKEKKITGVYASMKHMTENLSDLFKDIAVGIETLNSSSHDLSTVSEKMSLNAEQTFEKSNSVAAASEEMSANMNGVASATEQTSGNIQSIVSAIEEMSSTINEISSNTSKANETTAEAVKTAGHASDKINELGQAASDINKVTDTIADISSQTNLLALNATIEAARAGEAGKGFTVVAREIKALAQQTSEATSEISSKISSVQTTTQESVNAIESIVSIIDEINSIVSTVAAAIEEQSATTQEISSNVTYAATGVHEVNKNVNQTSVVVEEVTMDITKVSQAAEEIKTGGVQVNTSATNLTELAKSLNEMIGKFTFN